MVIPFPSFESNLTSLIDSAHELTAGQPSSAVRILGDVHRRVSRITGSTRHAELDSYVAEALTACRRGELDRALATLMCALSYFIPEQEAA